MLAEVDGACLCVCRQKHDKESFIAGRAKDVTGDHGASYSLNGREMRPEREKGYVMCHRSSTQDAKLNDKELDWCFREQPVGLLT